MHSWLSRVFHKPSTSFRPFSSTLDRTSLLPSIAGTIKVATPKSYMPIGHTNLSFNSRTHLSSLPDSPVNCVPNRPPRLSVRPLTASHEQLDLQDRLKAQSLKLVQSLSPENFRVPSTHCSRQDRSLDNCLSSSSVTHTSRQAPGSVDFNNPRDHSQNPGPVTTTTSSVNPSSYRSSSAKGQKSERKRDFNRDVSSEPLIDQERRYSRPLLLIPQRSRSPQPRKRYARPSSPTAVPNKVSQPIRAFSTTVYKPDSSGRKRSFDSSNASIDQTYDHIYDNNSAYDIPYSTLRDMPPRYNNNNNKARYGKHSAPKANKPSLEVLEGPLHTLDTVQALYQTQLKSAWLVEPKGPLSNYILSRTNSHKGLAAGGNRFKNVKGICEGTPIVRCSVVADEELGIIGVGDHPVAKEAEKIACLSALLQLAQQGQVDTGFGKFNPKLSGITLMGNQPQEATIMLSNRETITHSRARQFMDFYCNRFGFGKPIITYSDSAPPGQLGGAGNRKSRVPQTNWDAVMTVGGRKIGMGTGSSKKDALTKCYLDVTQYLESSDPPLWIEFKIKNPFEAGASNTAHVIFSISDDLEEDIRDLSKNIQASSLYAKAMDASTVAAVEIPPPVEVRAAAGTPASLLETKSKRLMAQLEAYQANPRISKLRDQRASLPVSSKSDHILAKIESNWVTICMAATGSGKTTQIPQIILDDYIRRGDGASCNVVCTQPRRIAAISVAQRVAAERDQRLGENVGYQVRFDTKMPQPNGSITFCTTGIFLKRLQSALGNEDPSSKSWLDSVSHIIVDEVHERDLDVDLLMVVLKQILKDRRDRGLPLRIVLMSATINPALFQQYFTEPSGRPAPVAEVPGRSYPVEKHFLDTLVPMLRNLPQNRGGWVFGDKDVLRFLNQELVPGGFGPNPPSDELKTPHALVALMISHIVQTTEEGHILVFLDGIDAINQVNKVLIDTYRYPLGVNFNTDQTPIHILHSSVPVAEQQRVFEPSGPGQRRIILATNIAETSITIPDVVYVVDTGRVKEKRYDSSKHLSSLVSAWVGQSNLNQRAGRAGRHREGEYYGVLSQARLRVLSEYAMVEMKRSDLSNVIMHIKALNFPNMEVEEVLADAIEPPTATAVENAIVRLKQVGALTDSKQLTSLGRVLQELPVEVQIGKLVLYGAFYRCLDSALTLAAVISDRDPFLAPMDKMTEANEIKDSWSPPGFRSDLLAVVSAYNYWFQMHASGRFREASAFLQANFLNRTNFLNIQKVKEQIWFALVDTGVIAICAGGMTLPRHGGRSLTAMPAVLNSNSESLPLLAALIATSSAPNFAIRVDQKQYRTSQDKKCHIHTSSVNQHRRENPHGESPAIIGEKAILAFVEKTSIGPVNQNAPSSLRTTTRLDPMTYMLFGAYHLKVTAQGLICDDWLPIQGQSSLDSLDEVQRLKDLLETCMLRVFEGVGQGLVKGRSERSHRRDAPHNRTATNTAATPSQNNKDNNGNNGDENDDEDSDDEGEHEVETERDDRKSDDRSLSQTEIIELDNLTSDVVAILDRYAQERGAGVSRASTRPSTPALMMPSMSIRQQEGPAGVPPPASYAAYENAPYRPPSMRSSIPAGPRAGTIGGGGGGGGGGAGGRGPGGEGGSGGTRTPVGGPGGMLPPTGPRGGAGPIKR